MWTKKQKQNAKIRVNYTFVCLVENKLIILALKKIQLDNHQAN